jgi:hypothetical protein
VGDRGLAREEKDGGRFGLGEERKRDFFFYVLFVSRNLQDILKGNLEREFSRENSKRAWERNLNRIWDGFEEFEI